MGLINFTKAKHERSKLKGVCHIVISLAVGKLKDLRSLPNFFVSLAFSLQIFQGLRGFCYAK